MGYGSRALQLLVDYYQGKFPSFKESVTDKPDTTCSQVSNNSILNALMDD